jgi:hypothetical protein
MLGPSTKESFAQRIRAILRRRAELRVSRGRAALYSLLTHHAETLPSHSIPLPYLPAATSNPLAWALLVSALERRARCSTGGSTPFSSGGEMSERKRDSSVRRGVFPRRRRGASADAAVDATTPPWTPPLPCSRPAKVRKNTLASCLWCWKFRSSSWFLAVAEAGGQGDTGPLHPQAAARGAGEEENAVAQQGGSRGDGLVTRD